MFSQIFIDDTEIEESELFFISPEAKNQAINYAIAYKVVNCREKAKNEPENYPYSIERITRNFISNMMPSNENNYTNILSL